MKKQGLLNKELNTVIASLGHTDTIVIADCGLPIPSDVPRIDLSLVKGEPPFLRVVDTILDEMVVESITLAEEIKEQNKTIHTKLKDRFAETPITYVPHDEFKQMMDSAKAVIRTGEATPYANVILHAGVNF
jgi:D-ribose pyranase